MKTRNLTLNHVDNGLLERVGDALSSGIRRRILSLLADRSYSTQQLLETLNIAPSTLSFHLKILKEAKIIKEISSPNKKGNEKNISLALESVSIIFGKQYHSATQSYVYNIPIGSFTNHSIQPPCMMATKAKIIDPVDNPLVFDSSERTQAELISFLKGHLEYQVVVAPFKSNKVKSVSFSLEVCSECPNFNNSWKSDITFWVNDVEIGNFRSLGDYGGRKGIFSPSWWSVNSSNFGKIVQVKIDGSGSYVNDDKVNEITIDNLKVSDSDFLRFRVGVKDNARYVGGLNIFGSQFGDYAQDINLVIEYY